MKNVIPVDSRYVPIVQQKWCCVPACISMLMYKHKIPLIPQEELGYHLGLLLPPEDRSLFWKTRDGNKPEAGWGTRVEKKQFSFDTVFAKLKIPLLMKLQRGKTFEADSLLNFLADAEANDLDIAICFDVGALENNNRHGGHVCVFDRVDRIKKTVRLIDPASSQPKWRYVTIENLLRGIQYKWNKSAGIWEFKIK